MVASAGTVVTSRKKVEKYSVIPGSQRYKRSGNGDEGYGCQGNGGQGTVVKARVLKATVVKATVVKATVIKATIQGYCHW